MTATVTYRRKATAWRKKKFCGLIAQGYSAQRAARGIQINRQTAFEWRNKDPAFAAAWQEAYDQGSDQLEDVAHERAITGSDSLLMFMLRTRRPEVYNRSQHIITGADGGPVVPVLRVSGGGMQGLELPLLSYEDKA